MSRPEPGSPEHQAELEDERAEASSTVLWDIANSLERIADTLEAMRKQK